MRKQPWTHKLHVSLFFPLILVTHFHGDVCLSRTWGIIREQEDQNWHTGSPRHTLLGQHFQGQLARTWEYCGGLAYIVNIH